MLLLTPRPSLATDGAVCEPQGAAVVLVPGLPGAAMCLLPRHGRTRRGADEGGAEGEAGGAEGTRTDHHGQRAGGEEKDHGLRHHVLGAAPAGWRRAAVYSWGQRPVQVGLVKVRLGWVRRG